MFEDLKPHIQDLRKRLMISALTLVVTFVICFTFWKHIFEWVKAPIAAAFASGVHGKLVQIAPAELIFVGIKVSFFAALIISIPIIFWQLWLFVAPGLYKHEKKLVLPFVTFGSIMFACGVIFSYYVVFPFIIKYVLAFGNDMADANISSSEYVTFFTRFILAFGIGFELPVLAYFLAKVGLITDKTVRHYFRYAIVVIFIVAAVITPPDVFSQLLLAVPMLLLYGFSYIIALIVNPASKLPKEDAEEDTEDKKDTEGKE
ncbi:twin arginine-targeting protein translocase TatC [Helicobacter sp. 13S00401-1]|uniref:twin-arginine translocase subunit TatC n=1 Tax=Helicobacter sp. 13S00401-1 TaxID=1905758 RepID=UPI000BA5DD66|nr:twin-arginine translocase subunit TatC [Helicobacter sp. 13S00401-1]PAF51422.1 twin arginine-targeting protein translocase TatC [Helicobacter sp. 13S00401-1]